MPGQESSVGQGSTLHPWASRGKRQEGTTSSSLLMGSMCSAESGTSVTGCPAPGQQDLVLGQFANRLTCTAMIKQRDLGPRCQYLTYFAILRRRIIIGGSRGATAIMISVIWELGPLIIIKSAFFFVLIIGYRKLQYFVWSRPQLSTHDNSSGSLVLGSLAFRSLALP